jgi:hypothetical protein
MTILILITKPPVPTETRHRSFFHSLDGKVHRAETRKYDFSLSSDDGSVLYINDKLMIENWQDLANAP